MTPPSGFLTLPQMPNNTTSERSHMINTVFVATTPENTSFAYRASTLTNPNPIISPVFVESNYEVLESLLRERRRQIQNEYLQTELEYFSEDTMKSERQNQDLSPTGKLLLPFIHGLLWFIGNEKELWDLRKHQIGKEAGEERTPKAKIGNPPTRGMFVYHPQGGICHRPSPTMAYLHIMVLLSGTDKRHRKETANKNQNKVTRPPEDVRRYLHMDYLTHNGSPKNSNNRRRNLQHRVQNKQAQTLGTSEAEEEKHGARKKQSDSHPSKGAYKGRACTSEIAEDFDTCT
nr:hypothetical protein [Tanacetum cinerariifolium]